MDRIITPLDGSELAERALPLAASLARTTGATLRLVEAALTPLSLEVSLGATMMENAATEYLAQQAQWLRERYRVPVDAHVGVAEPASLILEAAEAGASAIVMSTHGRTGLSRVLMGSVAERVLRQAPVPVYLVPSAAGLLPEHAAIWHILVPLDGSALGHSVLKPVTDLALASGAQVTLLRVFADDESFAHAPDHSFVSAVDQPLRRLRDVAHEHFVLIESHLLMKGVIVSGRWATGQPAAEILSMAEALKPSLIALATHGRSGLSRLRYGSVAESVLRGAKVPVMTVGPQALKRLAGDVSTRVDRRRAAEALVY
ncbi:MAG TPA: universal stress protein [Chloroflexota bacterium]|nr:universal stress protein [Chloroflexota bacterium]